MAITSSRFNRKIVPDPLHLLSFDLHRNEDNNNV